MADHVYSMLHVTLCVQAAKKDARIAKLEARIARRDASINQQSKAVKAAKRAAQKLAEKDAELHAKSEQIAALNARLAQFEQAAALMAAALAQTQQQSAPASGKKRRRKSKSLAVRYHISAHRHPQFRRCNSAYAAGCCNCTCKCFHKLNHSIANLSHYLLLVQAVRPRLKCLTLTLNCHQL
jgi:septal ring factor EnvC (AmiA/AmiB activator)